MNFSNLPKVELAIKYFFIVSKKNNLLVLFDYLGVLHVILCDNTKVEIKIHDKTLNA